MARFAVLNCVLYVANVLNRLKHFFRSCFLICSFLTSFLVFKLDCAIQAETVLPLINLFKDNFNGKE